MGYIKEDELKTILLKENLTLKKAAVLVNVSPLTLRRWISAGKVRSSKGGKKHLIKRSGLQVLKLFGRISESVYLKFRK